MDDKIDKVREALEIADAFCGRHTADECPDTIAIPIKDALAALAALSAIDASADPYAMHVCGTCSSESGAECTRRNCDLNNAWEPKPATPTILSAEPAQAAGKPDAFAIAIVKELRVNWAFDTEDALSVLNGAKRRL